MNTLPTKQEKTMKQIALKSFMQNNPFKHLEYMGIGCLIFISFRIPYETAFN